MNNPNRPKKGTHRQRDRFSKKAREKKLRDAERHGIIQRDRRGKIRSANTDAIVEEL